jgi:hypothetical protein
MNLNITSINMSIFLSKVFEYMISPMKTIVPRAVVATVRLRHERDHELVGWLCIAVLSALGPTSIACGQVREVVRSGGFQNIHYGHHAAENVEPTIVGGHMLMTGAGTKEVTQFIGASTEQVSRSAHLNLRTG